MKKLMILMVLLTMAESALCAASARLSIDNRKGTRVAKATERICFSPEWISEPSLYMTATVRANGTVLKSATEPGVFEWKPRQPGTYVLTHTVSVSSFDQEAGETLSATFEVRPDCVIHFHANGGVFAGKGRDVTTFDQPFFYGEPQKLMTDELNPMRMDGNGNQFLGWVRGTPEISSSDDLIYEGYVKTFEKSDETEEHFYAVWTTTLTVNFSNPISPSSLDDHLKWQVIGKESSGILKSGESIEVSPGKREIWLYVDAAYDWLVEGFDLGSVDNQNFNAYKGILTLNFSNDYTDPLLWRELRKSTRDVVAGIKYRSEGSPICFSCKHEIRESLRNQIQSSDVPFKASKVSITIEGTRVNESGILEPMPAHTLTGLKPGEEYFLPKGIYRIKSVTYDADQGSGDPYWGAMVYANQTFEVGAAEPIDYVDINFDLFGGEDVVMVKFDPQGGVCEKTRMWYTPAYYDYYDIGGGGTIRGVPHYRIYRMPPDPKKAGFEFENWFTAPTGGQKVKLMDDIIECILYAHWKTKVTEDWLQLYPELAARAKGDVETAASMTAANGCRTVGECYELGINPEDSNDDFKIISFEMKDGKPVIQLNHTKDGSGNSFESHVKTLGKARLSDEDWVDVTDMNSSALRFFKAAVDLP